MEVTEEFEFGCRWCQRELVHLKKAGFVPEMIEAYASFYGIGNRVMGSLKEVADKAGYTEEDAELAISDCADWLKVNSPYRSLPRRCSVCEHAQEAEDLAHLKESVAA